MADDLEDFSKYIEFIFGNSNLQRPQEMMRPPVQRVGQNDIQRLCGKEATGVDHAGCFRVKDGIPNVYLAYGDMTDPEDEAYFIHELAHYYQWVNGLFKRYADPKESEHQAYGLANEYLRQQGAERSEMFTPDWIRQRAAYPGKTREE